MLKYDLDPVKHPIIYDNKFGITDIENLLKTESDFSQQRAKEILKTPFILKGNFDVKYLLNLHKYLFQDVYPWAGQTRDVNISKGNSFFCFANCIEEQLKGISDYIEKKDYGKNYDRAAFLDFISNVSDNLNIVHPFREGNGRTKRLFLSLLSSNAGYELDFTKLEPEELLQAEINSFEQYDIAYIKAAYDKCLSEKTISDELQDLISNLPKEKAKQEKEQFYKMIK